MYFLFGPQHVLRNIYLLCGDRLTKEHDHNIRDLRLLYRTFLCQQQPNVPKNWLDDPFVLDDEIELYIASQFLDSRLDDFKQPMLIAAEHFDRGRKIRIHSKLRAALEILFSKDPVYKDLFELCIHTIFSKPAIVLPDGGRSAGGSTSVAIGAIWFSDVDSLTLQDVRDLVVHEFTHHCLFLDELCNEQFNYDEIVKKQNKALSAVLRVPRPMDKVVHSIIVSTEVLLSRRILSLPEDDVKLHPKSPALAKNILESVESVLSMENHRSLMTDWTLEMILRCRAAVAAELEIAR
jgi:hypothetical protein